MEDYSKYLKYKTKYLQLKQNGGVISQIIDINNKQYSLEYNITNLSDEELKQIKNVNKLNDMLFLIKFRKLYCKIVEISSVPNIYYNINYFNDAISFYHYRINNKHILFFGDLHNNKGLTNCDPYECTSVSNFIKNLALELKNKRNIDVFVELPYNSRISYEQMAKHNFCIGTGDGLDKICHAFRPCYSYDKTKCKESFGNKFRFHYFDARIKDFYNKYYELINSSLTYFSSIKEHKLDIKEEGLISFLWNNTNDCIGYIPFEWLIETFKIKNQINKKNIVSQNLLRIFDEFTKNIYYVPYLLKSINEILTEIKNKTKIKKLEIALKKTIMDDRQTFDKLIKYLKVFFNYYLYLGVKLIDFYVLFRMFKYDSDIIIVYAGQAHIDNYINTFKNIYEYEDVDFKPYQYNESEFVKKDKYILKKYGFESYDSVYSDLSKHLDNIYDYNYANNENAISYVGKENYIQTQSTLFLDTKGIYDDYL